CRPAVACGFLALYTVPHTRVAKGVSSAMSGSALERQIQSWLQTHPLFSILEEAALTCLVRELEMCSFAMGQTIVEEGTTGDAVYLVYAGKMRVVKDGPLGKPLTVATLGAGEIF